MLGANASLNIKIIATVQKVALTISQPSYTISRTNISVTKRQEGVTTYFSEELFSSVNSETGKKNFVSQAAKGL